MMQDEAVPWVPKRQKDRQYKTWMRLPEIKIGLQWEFEDSYMNKKLSGRKSTTDDGDEDEQADALEKTKPLKHMIGFTIPAKNFKMEVPHEEDMMLHPNYKLKASFPALSKYKDVTFFDNAGTCQAPKCVIEAASECMVNSFCYPDAGYGLSKMAARTIRRMQEVEKELINAAEDSCIIMGNSAGELIYRLIRLYFQFWNGEGEVVVAEAGDDSMKVHFNKLGESGITVTEWQVDVENNDPFPIDKLADCCGNASMFAIHHADPVLGEVLDMEQLVASVKGVNPNCRVLVDGSLYAQHRALDMTAWDVDYYVYDTSICYGPHMGILYAKNDALADLPFPNFDDIDEELMGKRFDIGIPNIEACAARLKTQEYYQEIQKVSKIKDEGKPKSGAALLSHPTVLKCFEQVQVFEEQMHKMLVRFLKAYPEVRIYGRHLAADTVPVITFNHSQFANTEIIEVLTKAKIQAVAGNLGHAGLFNVFDTDATPNSLDAGGVRVSLCHYNIPADVNKFIKVIEKLFGKPS